jgi:predicted 3-demethylubiquinone-9 3-methyltransferase (glyoxalase superfamily)
MIAKRITPFLWFDGNAEEAMNFYVGIFKNSAIKSVNPMGGSFELDGQLFHSLNGGPMFKFNEAVSFFISCEDQEEIDYYWNSLTADGGEESMCGWLKDKFGLSWQVVPHNIWSYLGGSDAEGSQRAMQAMMKMKKFDIAAMKAAYEGK